jgi:hypothetical protein
MPEAADRRAASRISVTAKFVMRLNRQSAPQLCSIELSKARFDVRTCK